MYAVIAEEQDDDEATPHGETPRSRRSGFCSGTNSHDMNATAAAVPYHPLIDKVGKVFDDRVAAFKQSLKRSLQEEMTTVLARVDLLDAELTETKRRAELNRVRCQHFAIPCIPLSGWLTWPCGWSSGVWTAPATTECSAGDGARSGEQDHEEDQEGGHGRGQEHRR